MTVILLFTFLTFLFYYLGSFDSANTSYKRLFVICFVIASFVLRYVIDPQWNNDYDLYFNFKIFQEPKNILSIFIGEPYLYLEYACFNFFFNDKEIVFLSMYWFTFLISTFFFVWLLTRKDIEMWKKMFLFTCYYFFFAFVLLRNGPAYILFAYYLYYTFREKKFYWVVLTPLMHLSSWVLLITLFHKKKNYFAFCALLVFLTVISFFFLFPVLSEKDTFDKIVFKINAYSSGMAVIGIMHKLYFLLITTLVLIGSLLYKKKMLHPIIVTTLVFYYLGFFINPVVGFRFSPFVFLALFLFNFDDFNNGKVVKILNYSSILLLPCFLYALFHTHHL